MLISITFLAYLPNPAHSRLYKWVDENGQVQFSDKLPPVENRQKHYQLNKQGQVIETYERQKTHLELQQQRERDKKLKLQVEQEAAAAKKVFLLKQHRNRTLLLTFSSEHELQQVHYNKLEVVDSVILLLDKIIAQNQIKLADLDSRAQQFFRSKGKPVPGGLAQKIEFYSRKIVTTGTHMNLKQDEREKLNERFQQDLLLYRQLTQTQ